MKRARAKLIVRRDTIRVLKANELVGLAVGAVDNSERNCITLLVAVAPVTAATCAG